MLLLCYNCRVLVSAVNKKTSLPELHFFNNCFGDEFSNGELLFITLMQFNFCIHVNLRNHVLTASCACRAGVEGGSLHNGCSYVLQRVRRLRGRRSAGQQPLRLRDERHTELLQAPEGEASDRTGGVSGVGDIPCSEPGQGERAGVLLLWQALVQFRGHHQEASKQPAHSSHHSCT